MKKLVFLIAFLGFFQMASAQDASISTTDPVVKITLAEQESEKAKLLKNLKYGELYKGESKTVFLVRTTEDNLELLKKELKDMFSSCKLEKVAEKK